MTTETTSSGVDVDAIRQREQAATKGPWTGEVYRSVLAGLATSTGNHGADAAFVRDARTDVPALLAKVDELTAELGKIADSIAPTVTVKPVSDAVWFLHGLYKDWAAKAHEQQAKVDELTAELAGLRADVESLTDDLSAVRTERDAIAAWANQTGAAAKVVDALRDYILNAIKGDGLDAAEMHDIAGDLATVLGYLGHPVANEDGCDCESYDCKGQCCGVGNCTCTPTRPIVTVELPAEATR